MKKVSRKVLQYIIYPGGAPEIPIRLAGRPIAPVAWGAEARGGDVPDARRIGPRVRLRPRVAAADRMERPTGATSALTHSDDDRVGRRVAWHGGHVRALRRHC